MSGKASTLLLITRKLVLPVSRQTSQEIQLQKLAKPPDYMRNLYANSLLGKESERSNSTLVLGICARHTQRGVCCKNIPHKGASNISLFIGSNHTYLNNNSNSYSPVPSLHVHTSYWLLSPPLLANQRNIKTTLIKNVKNKQNAKLR